VTPEARPVALHVPAIVGNVGVAPLAEQYGTPLYVFGDQPVRARLAELERVVQTVRDCRIFYSLKANPNPGLVELLATLGCGFDACSAFDLALLARLGVPSDQVTFCTHSLSDEDLCACVGQGVHVVADSREQVARYVNRSPQPLALGLRINVGVRAGFHPHVQAGATGSRFGVGPDVAAALLADPPAGARFVGLHCHVGSDVDDAEAHLQALDRLLELAERAASVGYVNLGGGIGIPFKETDNRYDVATLAEGAAKRLASFADRTGRSLELRLEPGSFLTREGGLLVGSVVEVRREGMTQLVITDTSVNHLAGALLYGTAHPMAVVTDGRVQAEAGEGSMPSVVVGNLMQPGDVLRREVRLPPLRAKDLVVFGLCGAYTGVRASTFNGRPRPAEVAVLDGHARLTRRRRGPSELVGDYDFE